MFSLIARRSTAVLTLVAALWLTTPLAAEAANRRPAPKAPATLGSLFLDQVASWLLDFFSSPDAADLSRQQKSGTGLTGNNPETDSAAKVEMDRGAMIDPNGCPYYQNCS